MRTGLFSDSAAETRTPKWDTWRQKSCSHEAFINDRIFPAPASGYKSEPGFTVLVKYPKLQVTWEDDDDEEDKEEEESPFLAAL